MVIVIVDVPLEGQAPLVANVIVYVLIALALKSMPPVEVLVNTKPTGLAEKLPVAPPVIFAIGSVPD